MEHKNNLLIKYTVIILFTVMLSSIIISITISKQMQNHLMLMHIQVYSSHISHIIKDHSEIINHFEKSVIFENESELTEFISEVKSIGNIIGIDLLVIDGTIIWSDQKGIIGKNIYSNKKQFLEAATGKTSYIINKSWEKNSDLERIYDKLIYIYVPIIINDKISGVIKLTESELSLFLLIYKNNKFIWIFISFSGLILFILLFQIFYNSYNSLNRLNTQLNETQNVTIYALGYLAELRDLETGKHLERTAKYVEITANELSNYKEYNGYLTKSYIKDLVKAAPLHDIGKVAISDSILLKPGKLTDEEFEIMKKHCELGNMILKKAEIKLTFQSFFKIALQITQSHHEKWDGTGYPDKLKGNNIPISARIMAIADVYDALRSERPYKKEITHEKTVEIILNEKGKHFDPLIVEAFMKNHEKFNAISLEYTDK